MVHSDQSPPLRHTPQAQARGERASTSPTPTSLTGADADAVRLASRYATKPSPGAGPKAARGRRKRRILLGTSGVVVIVAAVAAVAAFTSLKHSDIHTDAVTYKNVDSRTVDVTFSVTKDPATRGYCAVQVQEEGFAVAGLKVVPIEADGGAQGAGALTSTHTVRVYTDSPGRNAAIESCWTVK